VFFKLGLQLSIYQSVNQSKLTNPI